MKSHTDFFFGVNRTICGELIPGLAPGDADVLYPAIRVPSSQRPVRRRREGDDFRMCEFAAVNRKRRLDIAIQAAAELVKRGRRIQLMIAGERDEEHAAELGRLAERLGIGEQIEIRGFLSDVFTAMAECDAVVISAPVHGLGRTAVEGMLLGTPVVYPLGTGFDDVLEDGVTGLGYTAGDHSAMADRIDLLIQDPGLSAELALRAQNDAREMFSRENFSGKFYRRAVELAGRRHSCGNDAYRGFLEAMTATVVDQQQHAANLEEILKARDTEISALKRALQELRH
jgi:glycosyltransferase involved in cell wall biosynthesis